MDPQAATMGVAAHSGWAAIVVLGGALKTPTVLLRSRIELIDDECPESKQPYHAIAELPIEEAAGCLDRYRNSAEDRAFAALQNADREVGLRGHRLTAVGVLDSSGRKGASLQSILASHALIHSADGDHFRNALAAAALGMGLTVIRIATRDLDAQAEIGLQRPSGALRDVVADLGRQVGAPWGADQKNAALLGWLLLANP